MRRIFIHATHRAVCKGPQISYPHTSVDVLLIVLLYMQFTKQKCQHTHSHSGMAPGSMQQPTREASRIATAQAREGEKAREREREGEHLLIARAAVVVIIAVVVGFYVVLLVFYFISPQHCSHSHSASLALSAGPSERRCGEALVTRNSLLLLGLFTVSRTRSFQLARSSFALPALQANGRRGRQKVGVNGWGRTETPTPTLPLLHPI